MTLRDVSAQLASFDADATIYVESPSGTARAVVISEPENGGTPEPNLVYLLEVGLAREAIDVWHAWRPGRSPSLDDQLQAVIYYAENDAWLPVE